MSQFTIYSSSDVGGPGSIAGTAGSLITILDACLVNGYTGKTAAGWTRPVVTASNIGSYKQGSGSLLGIVVNDNGPNGTSTYKEAWLIGWEVVAGVGASVGSGTNQFPTPAQLLTTGHVVCRKSTTADSTAREWLLAADNKTFYLWTFTGDSSGVCQMVAFGDIYSLYGSSDSYRCLIMGNAAENSATSTSGTISPDVILCPVNGATAPILVGMPGHFVARTYGGLGGSILVNKKGDTAFTAGAATASYTAGTAMIGSLPTPNGTDNSLYISPLWIVESSIGTVRGRMRGLFHVCHPIANFAHGQTFAGTGDFSGKSMMIIKTGPNGGYWGLETSDTLDTN